MKRRDCIQKLWRTSSHNQEFDAKRNCRGHGCLLRVKCENRPVRRVSRTYLQGHYGRFDLQGEGSESESRSRLTVHLYNLSNRISDPTSLIKRELVVKLRG